MGLFGKKKGESKGCCEGAGRAEPETVKTEGAAVKVLGSGCKKCNELEANAKEALMQLGMDTAVDHVTDFVQIASYGVMSTPALVVNGKVAAFGQVLKTDEIVKILQKTIK